MSAVGARVGTKTWSDIKADESKQAPHEHNMSADDIKKMGADDVGQLLNQISDPNYVDPSKKVRAVGSDKMDKDAFMKMMLAQMKNQDPTNPLKSHEMAAQLAQFSSVEQLTNINTLLEEIKNGQKPGESFQALSFIGKVVAGDSAKLVRTKGDKEHDFIFNLPEDAKNVTIKVRNAAGDIVRKMDLKDLKKGENKWVWNGKIENGTTAPVGEYQFIIEAKNSAAKGIAVKTDFNGLISGVSYSAEGPVLLVGNQSVKMKDVRKIVDPSLKSNDQKINKPGPVDLKNQQAASENEDKGAEEAQPKPTEVLGNVAMSQGLIDQVENEVKPGSKPPVKPSEAQLKAESAVATPAPRPNVAQNKLRKI